ncbi:MAG TPA: amylo-alpha-1,6-glucosidase [Chthoniobacterales bacterium]|nr:amylo-alpha-1,6-glucosidase [Chthoniobacterales bacterium]
MSLVSDSAEWLEADGLGGFASGTTSGIRTRRYHALLLTATAPPSERKTLVNGFEAWVETIHGSWFLSSQRYGPDVVYPNGMTHLKGFEAWPWPSWRFELDQNLAIEQEVFVPFGQSAVVLIWKLAGDPGTKVKLTVRPLLSGRDFHATHHENSAFRFDPESSGGRVRWKPYHDVPAVVARSNGTYHHSPTWYRNFCYAEERARGLDYLEDLASPGLFEWELQTDAASLIFVAEDFAQIGDELPDSLETANQLRAQELQRRKAFSSPLDAAAESYLVRRGSGMTIIAGYPWFGDWGRDTFISLRGLCLATNRLETARDILVEWAGNVSQGMLPNRFPDRGVEPEFNSVDASLWYIIAVFEYLRAAQGKPNLDDGNVTTKLRQAIEAILSGYREGTRFGIKADEDGLLAAGQPGVQLTWMDAKVGGQVVTPRIGKPVEVQALWINALWVGQSFSPQWKSLFAKASEAFATRFWNEARQQLYDVIDVDHRAGTADPLFRPNQIFAVGGLPLVLLPAERARQVVDAVEAALCTPIGLRSLAPGEPGYVPRYQGDVWHRDSAYHQGTVWPWLIGPFVEAWVRVRGDSPEVKALARKQFLEPLRDHLNQAGLGHLSEIADADPPHTPRGCPFQGWSMGELLRLDRIVL